MSDDVRRCDRCGGDIVIRWMGSALVPIHLSGSCGGGGQHWPPSAWAHRHEDFTRATTCRICGESVFFVRHNGGSVWFDELGPPWDKHPCFEDDPSSATIRSALRAAPSGALLGIVLEAVPEHGGSWGRVVVRCSHGTMVDERLPFAHLGGGRAVIVLRRGAGVVLTPIGKPARGSFDEHQQLLKDSARQYARHIVCPRCGNRTRPENARFVVIQGARLAHCARCGNDFQSASRS
jgi:hypothetical protein